MFKDSVIIIILNFLKKKKKEKNQRMGNPAETPTVYKNLFPKQ